MNMNNGTVENKPTSEKKRPLLLITFLTGGLGIAIFNFAINKAWDLLGHRNAEPDYVTGTIRFEEGNLLLFIRNSSDEPLDLVGVRFEIVDRSLEGDNPLGAYPDVSKIYQLSMTTSGTADLSAVRGKWHIRLKIAQAIPPRSADQFGVSITGPLGAVDLSQAQISARLEDMQGKKYYVESN